MLEYITDEQRKLAGAAGSIDDSQSFAVGTDLEGADIRTLNTVGDIEEVVGDCCDELGECEVRNIVCQGEITELEEEITDLTDRLEELCSSQPPVGSWTVTDVTGCGGSSFNSIYDISANVKIIGPTTPGFITLQYSSSKIWRYDVDKNTGSIRWDRTSPNCIGGQDVDMRVVVEGGNCNSSKITAVSVNLIATYDVLACYSGGAVIKVGTIEVVSNGDVIFTDDRFAACEPAEEE